MRCQVCRFDYPESYLYLFQSSLGNIGDICGICALKLSNDVHGIERTKFDGPQAEKMRQKAIKWRERHHEHL